VVNFTEEALLPVPIPVAQAGYHDCYELQSEKTFTVPAGFSATICFNISISPQIGYGMFVSSIDRKELFSLYVPEFVVISAQQAPFKVVAHNQTTADFTVFKGEPVVRIHFLPLANLSMHVSTCKADINYFDRLRRKHASDHQIGGEAKRFKFFDRRPQ